MIVYKEQSLIIFAKEVNMTEFLYTLLVVFVIVGMAFLLINIKYIFKKEEFKKSCSLTGESCNCSDEAEEACPNQIVETFE